MKKALIALGGLMLILVIFAFACDGYASGQGQPLTPICHRNSDGSVAKIFVATASIPAHLAHGDVFPGLEGTCLGPKPTTTTSSTTTTTSEVPTSTSTSTTETTSPSSSTTSTSPSTSVATSTTTTISSIPVIDAPSAEIGSAEVVERQTVPSTEAKVRTTG